MVRQLIVPVSPSSNRGYESIYEGYELFTPALCEFVTINEDNHIQWHEEAVMPTEIVASATLQKGLHFTGSVAGGNTIEFDSPSGAGPSPMEAVLMSLASCSGMDVISILRKQRQPVEGLQVRVRGQRRDEHPTVFTTIQIEYIVHGQDVDPAAVERAITLSRERYCPVWAMLGHSVAITPMFRVVSGDLAIRPVD